MAAALARAAAGPRVRRAGLVVGRRARRRARLAARPAQSLALHARRLAHADCHHCQSVYPRSRDLHTHRAAVSRAGSPRRRGHCDRRIRGHPRRLRVSAQPGLAARHRREPGLFADRVSRVPAARVRHRPVGNELSGDALSGGARHRLAAARHAPARTAHPRGELRCARRRARVRRGAPRHVDRADRHRRARGVGPADQPPGRCRGRAHGETVRCLRARSGRSRRARRPGDRPAREGGRPRRCAGQHRQGQRCQAAGARRSNPRGDRPRARPRRRGRHVQRGAGLRPRRARAGLCEAPPDPVVRGGHVPPGQDATHPRASPRRPGV